MFQRDLGNSGTLSWPFSLGWKMRFYILLLQRLRLLLLNTRLGIVGGLGLSQIRLRRVGPRQEATVASGCGGGGFGEKVEGRQDLVAWKTGGTDLVQHVGEAVGHTFRKGRGGIGNQPHRPRPSVGKLLGRGLESCQSLSLNVILEG